jgi:hypothetical protein
MRVRVLAGATVLSLLGLILGWAATSSAATRASRDGTTIRVEARQTAFNTAGTSYTITSDSFRNGQKVGSNQIVCDLTGPGPLALCNSAHLLPKGEIVAAGSVTTPPQPGHTYTVAIVGGTGAYANARGTLDVTNVNPTSDTYTFHISSESPQSGGDA